MKLLTLSSMSNIVKNIPLLTAAKNIKKFDLNLDKFIITKVQPLINFLKSDISFGMGLKCWHVLVIVGGILVIKIIFEAEDNKSVEKIKSKLNKYIKENPTKTKIISLCIVVGSALILFL